MNIKECETHILHALVDTGEFRRLGLKSFIVDFKEQDGVFVRAWGPKIAGRQEIFDLRIAGASFTKSDIDKAIKEGLALFRKASEDWLKRLGSFRDGV